MRSRVGVAVREARSAVRHPWTYSRRLVSVRYPSRGVTTTRSGKRMFSLDLHAAGTASVRGGLDLLNVELVQWMIGDPKHVARDRPRFAVADPVAIVNRHTWKDLSEGQIDAFWARYGDYLGGFDGFLVNHSAALAQLFMPTGKPILLHNTSRYECPYTDRPERWSILTESLRSGVDSGQVTVISNNHADADYLSFYAGVSSPVMSSVTDYAPGTWRPTRPEIALSSVAPQLEAALRAQLPAHLVPLPLLFPDGYSYQQLFSLSGVVVVPYQVSTMFMFELMNAGMPLLVPSDDLLQEWYVQYPGVLSQLSYLQVGGIDTRIRPRGDLNRICDETIRQWWLDRADFGPLVGYPRLRRFSSLEHLEHLLANPPKENEGEVQEWIRARAQHRQSLLEPFVESL